MQSIMARLDKTNKPDDSHLFFAEEVEAALSAAAVAGPVPPSFENWLAQPTVVISPERFTKPFRG